MAWEVRGAGPNFPVTIFVEIQTSPTSTGRTLFSRTPRNISKNPPPHHINQNQPAAAVQKGFGRGLGEPFPQKGSPKSVPK